VNKKLLILISLVGFIILFALLFLFATGKQVKAPTKSEQTPQPTTTAPPTPSSPDFTGNEDAFKNALNLYIQKKKEGVDMASGPCLGKIADDWVLDIAHNPRLPEDDKVQNQCPDYISGKVRHFIEMDPNGKLITSR